MVLVNNRSLLHPIWAILALCVGCATLSDGAAPETGYLQVECTPPDASIYVDGEHRGNLALWRGGVVPIEAGRHRVEIVHVGYLAYQFDLDLRPDQMIRLGLELIKDIEELDDLDGRPSAELEEEGRATWEHPGKEPWPTR